MPRGKRKAISFSMKLKILDLLANGHNVPYIVKQFGLHDATVRTIRKNEVNIRKSVGAGIKLNTSKLPNNHPYSMQIKSKKKNSVLKVEESSDEASTGAGETAASPIAATEIVKSEDSDNDVEIAASGQSGGQSPTIVRSRKSITLDMKSRILDLVNRGESYTDIGIRFGLNEATVRTIKKNEEIIRKSIKAGMDPNTKRLQKTMSAKIQQLTSTLPNGHSTPAAGNFNQEPMVLTKRLRAKEILNSTGSLESSSGSEAKPNGRQGIKRRPIPLGVKMQVLDRIATGQSSQEIGKSFGLSASSVRMIKKNELSIRQSMAYVAKLNHRFDTPPIIYKTSIDGRRVKVRKTISLDLKNKILDRLAIGHGPSSVGKYFGLNEATVRTIKKNEERIRSAVSFSTTEARKTLCYKRDVVREKMEKALAMWIKDNSKHGITIDRNTIQRTALRTYKKIRDKDRNSVYSTSVASQFCASKNWLRSFLKRNGLDNMRIKSEFESEVQDMECDNRGSFNDYNETLVAEAEEEHETFDTLSDENELSAVALKRGLELAHKLNNYFMENDCNEVRVKKFRRELQAAIAPYKDLYINLTRTQKPAFPKPLEAQSMRVPPPTSSTQTYKVIYEEPVKQKGQKIDGSTGGNTNGVSYKSSLEQRCSKPNSQNVPRKLDDKFRRAQQQYSDTETSPNIDTFSQEFTEVYLPMDVGGIETTEIILPIHEDNLNFSNVIKQEDYYVDIDNSELQTVNDEL